MSIGLHQPEGTTSNSVIAGQIIFTGDNNTINTTQLHDNLGESGVLTEQQTLSNARGTKYFETSFFQTAYEKLKKTNVVLLNAGPNEGIKATQKLISDHLQDHGFTVQNINTLEELIKKVNAGAQKIVFVLSNCFNKTHITNRTKTRETVLPDVRRIFEKANKSDFKVVLSCDSYYFKKMQKCFHQCMDFLQEASVTVTGDSPQVIDDRLQIMKNLQFKWPSDEMKYILRNDGIGFVKDCDPRSPFAVGCKIATAFHVRVLTELMEPKDLKSSCFILMSFVTQLDRQVMMNRTSKEINYALGALQSLNPEFELTNEGLQKLNDEIDCLIGSYLSEKSGKVTFMYPDMAKACATVLYSMYPDDFVLVYKGAQAPPDDKCLGSIVIEGSIKISRTAAIAAGGAVCLIFAILVGGIILLSRR